MLKATDLRKGKVIKIDGKLVRITDFQHITPGNWRGIVQIKYKDIITGNGSQKRISPEDKFEDVYLDNRKMQYLYKQGDNYVFMDMETYEQPEISADVVGDAANYLRENDECNIMFYEGKVVSLELPPNVTLTVEYTEPGVKGDTVQNVTKPAKLETGLEIKVPNHIHIGDRVKVDTRTGEFVERDNS
ncbi:MAG: elongation factor P [Planctomycetes bacterium]|nr:elongation factor P [Planctomycetota bacterium]MCB9934731.1 elongation factor P [Planctomycetota bacterium]MCG3184463.1 Elongation factor P [Planctomycetota bacterium]MCZ7605482.1 elongation factor P [Planctomycetota bacterium]